MKTMQEEIAVAYFSENFEATREQCPVTAVDPLGMSATAKLASNTAAATNAVDY